MLWNVAKNNNENNTGNCAKMIKKKKFKIHWLAEMMCLSLKLY